MPDDVLKRIIDKAVASGHSDDDIRLLVQEHKRRTATATPPSPPATFMNVMNAGPNAPVLNAAIGAAKGAANTVFGLGKVVRDYTPIGRVSDAISPGAFDKRPKELEPDGAMQKAGYAAEQLGEFFIPTGAAGKAGKVAEVGKSALLTKAQTGSSADAGISAAVTAAAPAVVATTARLAAPLAEGAQKAMTQALGATKEWAKVEAAKLAPEMLKRGVRGSRPAMLEHAKAVSERVGAELNAAYKAATDAGESVSGDVVRGHIQLVRDAMKVKDAAGKRIVIPGTEAAVQQMDRLDEFVGQLGKDIPVDKAAVLKRTWDRIVSKAGLFGQKATSSATDNAQAYGIREASGAFRELLNTNPTIEALNKELAFWTGLKKVLIETEKRTQAQSGGLVAAGMGGSGAIVGAVSGDSPSDKAMKALLGGLAGRQLIKVVTSPAWRTTITGPSKQMLADALASGSTNRVMSALMKVSASVPAQLSPAHAQ